MFEKEAEEYGEKDLGGKYLSSVVAKDKLHAYKLGQYDGFVAGAEFGYNKANEWHYVKDKLPELYKDVLVVFPRGDCDVKRLTNHNEWVGRGSWCSLTDVIAWKEIVLPELKESEIKSEMFPEIILPEGSAEFVDKVIADTEKRLKEIE